MHENGPSRFPEWLRQFWVLQGTGDTSPLCRRPKSAGGCPWEDGRIPAPGSQPRESPRQIWDSPPGEADCAFVDPRELGTVTTTGTAPSPELRGLLLEEGRQGAVLAPRASRATGFPPAGVKAARQPAGRGAGAAAREDFKAAGRHRGFPGMT